jgi:hypothetical protein
MAAAASTAGQDSTVAEASLVVDQPLPDAAASLVAGQSAADRWVAASEEAPRPGALRGAVHAVAAGSTAVAADAAGDTGKFGFA